MPLRNNLLKINEAQRLAVLKRKEMFAAAFSTPAGKAVVEYLREKYLDKPVCVIDNVYFGYVREGQNDVVRDILEMIK